MASLPPQECCVQGVKHEGTPKGSVIDVDDIKAYVTGNKQASKAILFITDVYGHEFINSQLLADTFAENGYLVLIPDLFNGDALAPNEGSKVPEWRPRHGIGETQPNVIKGYEWLKREVNPKFIGAVGYCFGAKYAIRSIGDMKLDIDAVAVAHPSFVSIGEVSEIKKPILISGAENDPLYTPELREATEETLKSIKATYFLTELSGVSHGFAVRGDPKVPWQKIAKEKTFNDFLWWFSLFQ